MKLYNTLTRSVEYVKPREEGKIQMFVCGPTVYDFSHLGHAKTYTQLDVLARTLRLAGYDTFYLQNITDIDDKIIMRAAENKISWEELRSQYETEYYTDMQSLGNTSVTQYARATDYIPNIIQQVQTLLDKGHAYVIDDGIYFEISTFPDYGKLSGRQEVEKDDAQTRIDHSDEKRGWNDFCLWKFSKADEPSWEAPFGTGRPGWHIEDTAISEHFFGPQYDVHGGAVDLIFPHHEAEITQMESASGKQPFVQYWVHTGFLTIDDTKMSKSLKNFYTIREVLEKGYDPMAIRLLMLQSHYRSAVNFTWDSLDAANNRLLDLRAMAALQWQPIATISDDSTPLPFESASVDLATHMQNDLNSPQALALLSDISRQIQTNLIDTTMVVRLQKMLTDIDQAFGLQLTREPDITDEQKAIIARREQARADKDWSQSDVLRSTLVDQGIGLRDTPSGTVWFPLV